MHEKISDGVSKHLPFSSGPRVGKARRKNNWLVLPYNKHLYHAITNVVCKHKDLWSTLGFSICLEPRLSWKSGGKSIEVVIGVTREGWGNRVFVLPGRSITALHA